MCEHAPFWEARGARGELDIKESVRVKVEHWHHVSGGGVHEFFQMQEFPAHLVFLFADEDQALKSAKRFASSPESLHAGQIGHEVCRFTSFDDMFDLAGSVHRVDWDYDGAQ